MIIFICIMLCVFCTIAFSILDRYRNMDGLAIFSVVCAWIFGIASAILLVILMFTYPTSLDNVSQLTNFYHRNYAVWQHAIEKYPTAVEIDTKGTTAVTTNVTRDFIQQVLNYNEELQWYKLYQNNWFYAPFITEVPRDLEFLEIPK